MSKPHDDDALRGLRESEPGTELEPAELAAGFEALRAAYAPGEIDPELHEALLSRALGGELEAPAIDERGVPEELQSSADRAERERAEALRAALDGAPSTPEARALLALARVLRYAHEPPPLVEIHHEALLGAALGRRSKLRRITTGVVGALAAAADRKSVV